MKNHDPTRCCILEIKQPQRQAYDQRERVKDDAPTNGILREAGVALLTQDKIEFEIKS